MAAFLELLRDADVPLTASALKRRLTDRGVSRSDADAAWRRAQPALRRSGAFDPVTKTYAAPGAERGLEPGRALDELVGGRSSLARRVKLAQTVRAALAERDELEARLRRSYADASGRRDAQDRQSHVDTARTLARVAMELEELAASGARPWVMVERVRALARMSDLEPIGRAGEETAFDASRHAAVAGSPPPGARVAVVRPGYTWRSGERAVVIDRALVAPV
jgi:hypothetical protein